MNSLKILFLLSIAGLILTSCGQASENNKIKIASRSPISVSTEIANSQSADNMEILSGKIQAKNKATVSAQMMGYVSSLKVKIGDKVKAGQTILTIKNNELPAKRNQINASINEANASLKNVKINYDRLKVLWEQQSITRKEWEDISTQYEMMKAKVEGATSMRNEVDQVIAKTIVTTPISGVVTTKLINQGDLVNPGVPLMTIESNNQYEVATNISDKYISQIKKGMSVNVEIEPLGKQLKAIISEISPSALNTGGQFGILADLILDNDDLKNIFPGMYANVFVKVSDRINEKTNSNIMIDKSALITRGQLVGLYTVSQQGTALLRWVRTGKESGNKIEIVSGLNAGEEYITSNIDQLVDGVPISK